MKKKTPTYRVQICYLKSDKNLDGRTINKIKNSLNTDIPKDAKKELAFRLALYMAKNGNVNEARAINNKHLHDAEIDSYCYDQEIIKQEMALRKLNEYISMLSQGQLSAPIALRLVRSLPDIFSRISHIAPLSQNKKIDLEESIKNYIIEQLFKEGDYISCQKSLMSQNEAYLTDPLCLRNIAIMSLYAAENNQLTEANYKECIALWATSIYQLDFFVESLDYTTWDDPYSFTLKGALGFLSDNSDLPENVNYNDETEDKVISIRKVQRNLIERMEEALDNSSQKYLNFYKSQNYALEELSKVKLKQPCVIVAPYLLEISPQYKLSVTRALELEEKTHNNWEKILQIGHLYGITSGSFGDYQTAYQYYQGAVESIHKRKDINNSFDTSRIDTIKKYVRLFTSLVSTVKAELQKSIEASSGYKKVMNDFYLVCKNFKDNELSNIFSTYINKEVHDAFGAKTLALDECADILLKVYKICTSNNKFNMALGSIVNALIPCYLTNNKNRASHSLKALDNILSYTRVFDQSVVKALSGDSENPENIIVGAYILPNEEAFNILSNTIGSKSTTINEQFKKTKIKLKEIKIRVQLNEIIEKANKGGALSTALSELYDLYKENMQNDNVCSALVSIIPACIMKYIAGNERGRSTVINILNKLKSNMSLTFCSHKSSIREEYNKLMNQLPPNARIALWGNPSSLTEQGLNLKMALDYLKEFSD